MSDTRTDKLRRSRKNRVDGPQFRAVPRALLTEKLRDFRKLEASLTSGNPAMPGDSR